MFEKVYESFNRGWLHCSLFIVYIIGSIRWQPSKMKDGSRSRRGSTKPFFSHKKQVAFWSLGHLSGVSHELRAEKSGFYDLARAGFLHDNEVTFHLLGESNLNCGWTVWGNMGVSKNRGKTPQNGW